MMLAYPARRLTHLWLAHEALPLNPKLVSYTTGRAVFADLVAVFTQGPKSENWHSAFVFRERVMRQYHDLVAQQLISVVQDFKIEVTDNYRMLITYNLLWRPHDHLTLNVPLTPLNAAAREKFLNDTEDALGDAERWLKEQPPVRLG